MDVREMRDKMFGKAERQLEQQQPQVIKIQPKKFGDDDAWEDSSGFARESEDLSLEIEVAINEIVNKTKILNEKLLSAYKSAPLTDTGFGACPIHPSRILHAMKNHMRKYGLHIDYAHIGDLTIIKDFSAYVEESLRWLLKFKPKEK